MRPGRGILGPPACTYEHIGARNRLEVRVRVPVPANPVPVQWQGPCEQRRICRARSKEKYQYEPGQPAGAVVWKERLSWGLRCTVSPQHLVSEWPPYVTHEMHRRWRVHAADSICIEIRCAAGQVGESVALS